MDFAEVERIFVRAPEGGVAEGAKKTGRARPKVFGSGSWARSERRVRARWVRFWAAVVEMLRESAISSELRPW